MEQENLLARATFKNILISGTPYSPVTGDLFRGHFLMIECVVFYGSYLHPMRALQVCTLLKVVVILTTVPWRFFLQGCHHPC